MRVISDLSADNVLGICKQGQTLPAYVQGSDHEIYLAKHSSTRSGLTSQELVVELLANLIAQSLDLCVATPALIKLSDTAIGQLEDVLETTLLEPFVVGLRYVEITPFLFPSDLSAVPQLIAARVILLDLLLANGDRVPENPNVAWAGDQLLIFDHDHCLELPHLDAQDRLSVHQGLFEPCLTSHLLSRIVSSRDLSKCIETTLPALDAEPLADLVAIVPENWLRCLMAELNYIRSLIGNWDEFFAPINRS